MPKVWLKGYRILVLIFALSSIAHAQGSAYYRKEASQGSPTPFPLVTVCTSSASLVTLPCTGLASIFTTDALSVAMPNPFRGDSRGNIEFHAAAGIYVVSITSPYSPGYSFKVLLGSSAGGATLGGSIANKQVAVGNGPNTIAGSDNFKYDPPNGGAIITTSDAVGPANVPASGFELVNGGGGAGTYFTKSSSGNFSIRNDAAASPAHGFFQWDPNGNMILQGGGNSPYLNFFVGTSTSPFGFGSATLSLYGTGSGPHVFAVQSDRGLGDLGYIYSDPFNDDLCFGGNATGVGCIGFPTTAGTPNKIKFPTTTGTSGQFLKTNGGNPQQLSWANAGGIPANTPGIPSSNGNTFYASNYGVKADSYAIFDGVCTNGAATITSASAHFQTVAKINVGQLLWVINNPQGGALAMAKTTVKTIDSDSQITANANGNANCGSAMAVIWGDDDTAALNATWTASQLATDCGQVVLPAGGMIISGGVMNAPLASNCLADIQEQTGSIHGQGWASTIFIPTPDFDLTTCTGGGKFDCIGPSYDDLGDFSINGFGLPTTTVSSTTATIITVNSPATLRNVYCEEFAFNNTNLTNFNVVSGLAYMYNAWVQGCGTTGPIYNGIGAVTGSYLSPGSGTVTISVLSPGSDFFNTFIGASTGSECAATITGFAHFFGLVAQQTGPGSEHCVTGSGSRAWYTGSQLFHAQAIAGRAALKLTTSALASATNSTFTETGAGAFAVSVDATSKFIDGCGNTYTGNINVTAGGIFVPCPGTIYTSDLNMPTLTGTGACATFTAQHGTMYYGQFTCTGTTGAATITLSPGGTAAVHGFRCSASDTTTQADTITTGTLSTTSCAFSAAAIASNDVISFQAVPF